MTKQDLLRNLPSVDRLLSDPHVASLAEEHGHELVVWLLRCELEAVRARILRGEEVIDIPATVRQALDASLRLSLRHAVNAAGVVLHTGLGRAMLAPAAVEAVHDAIRGYCTLATDAEQGKRMSRDEHLRDVLCELTGADSGTFANNNAAATMLVLNTLAQGKEVIVSRGQLVEIGGSFRMPEVMEMSGATMREVGTTNKTHLKDYERAISENTGALLRVHQSNYRIMGFTSEPGIEELVALGDKHGLPVIDDLGSGALIDLSQFGLEREPLIQESVKAGAAVACFSGDKLIGGPQCGIMVGKREIIERIKKNPLARALRIGKLTVAALEATLRLFLDEQRLCEKHPTYRMFSAPLEGLKARAEALAAEMGTDPIFTISHGDDGSLSLKMGSVPVSALRIIESETEVGSGSVPTQTLPTWAIAVQPQAMTPEDLARRLRYHEPPIFARIHKDSVLFDLRTIQPEEDELVAAALRSVLQ
ncbi:MAG: L-seryl-tRNA(Sec) selenium transferase [Armatimonadia bacterium]